MSPVDTRLFSTRDAKSFTFLNESQRHAVAASLVGAVTCIWGPPGTGKTHTIVSIIHGILASDLQKRLLVTAPTHNAVDHVMRQYLKHMRDNNEIDNVHALRVSTDLRKVSTDIRAHTCDAMLGKDINQFPNARKKAQQQITRSRLIFTTCIGAGLGLLRNEHFENVIIDEASQQTEPASLVPLIKGATRAILVGDHVQLRATVHPNAQTLGFDISLFERLWLAPTDKSSVHKVMLKTQYRMHPQLCAFLSREFYEAKLQSATHCKTIPLPSSTFAWPSTGSRSVFIQVSTPEDQGRKSKSNIGQAQICQDLICQLRAASSPDYPIAILTPYTRQADLLCRLIPSEAVSSIDGFQGQEADVIVYVTVRCNLYREIGFLKDMRRLNVAVTRAKAGLVIIGDERTLVGRGRVEIPGSEGTDNDGGGSYEVWKRLIGSMSKIVMELETGSGDEVGGRQGQK